MKGEFTRWESSFRHWVTPDGAPDSAGDGGFAAEPGRYHLYVSYACPYQLDARLGERRYLLGEQPTEADWRLCPTLLRFDPVYYGHFKCNLRRLVDYPNLWGYTRDLHQLPGIAATVDMDHIKTHY